VTAGTELHVPSLSLSELTDQRFSCRGFKSDPVPRDTIEDLLITAGRSPSWCNTQPWRVIVTSGDETETIRRSLVDWANVNPPTPDLDFPLRYEGAALERRRECGWQLYESVGIAKGDREASAAQNQRNFELFGAPHLAVITGEQALGTYGAIDCGLYVAYFLLAAQSLGIATIAQAAIAACAPYLRNHFELPDDRVVICGVSFGYADPDHPANQFRTRRASLDELVTWAGKSVDK
jgi:nitroreductase